MKDPITIVNLILSVTILALGIKRYRNSGVKAFICIGLGFLMFGISHVAKLAGIEADWTAALTGVRIAGYLFVIIGMLL